MYSRRHFHPEMPGRSSRKPSNSSSLRSGYRAYPRSAISLYNETFHEVTLDTGTRYPCTQEDLDATGGIDRQTASHALKFKNRLRWFANPNHGPFVDARIAAREIFDHNALGRTPSVAESDAINRLYTGIERATREHWAPDLAIKAFCDLDKVFFCGRLRGHVCLSWKPQDPSGADSFGCTWYLRGGQCEIQLYASDIFFGHESGSSRFVQMFQTLLHEMM